ncbi:MAG: hypothetical protein ACOC54_05765, partial [Candidatus Sumerlaeota bacterium]
QEKSISRVLVDMGLITEEAKMTYLNQKFGYEIVDISGMNIEADILTRLPRSYAEKFRCVPILIENHQLIVAMEDPTDIKVMDDIRSQSSMELLPVLAPLADIEKALLQYPVATQKEADSIFENFTFGTVLKIIHTLIFFAIMLAPLVFLIAGSTNEAVSDVLLSFGTAFEVMLGGILIWIIWSIFIWYIDGLIFRSRKS